MQLGRYLIDVAPLRNGRDFRLVFMARVVSLLGLGVATVAVPLQAYALTGSSLHVAGVSAVLGTTALLGTLAGGVLADRLDRKRLIMTARGTATLAFTVLAVNAALPEPHLWVVYAAVALNGATSVSNAALVAATPELVGRDKIMAAVALVTLSTELGAVVGPAVAGIVIAGPGLAVAFGATAAASLVTTSLIGLVRPLPPGDTPIAGPLRSLQDGAAFVVRHRLIGGLLLIDVFAMLFALPVVLYPQLAHEVFGGDPRTVGLLFAAPAVGAVLAAVGSGWTGRAKRAVRALVGLVVGTGVAMLGFGLCAVLAATRPAAAPAALAGGVVLLAVSGALRTSADVLRRGLIQQYTPAELQGRVNSVWLAQVMVSPPLGGLQSGLAAHLLGPALAVAAGGLVCVVGTAAVAVAVPAVRRAVLAVDPEAR